MMKQLVAALGVVVASVGATSAQAQNLGPREAFLPCPAQELEASLTSRLKDDWRAPRIIGELVETRVRNRNNGTRLVCRYQMLGDVISVRKPQPAEFEECKASRDGFVCRRPGRPGGAAEVAFELKGGEQFDLDKGLRGRPAFDILLQRRGALKRALTPVGSAAFAPIGFAEPTRRDCRRASYGDIRLDVSRLRPGYFFCVRTSDNRLSRVRITRVRKRVLGSTRVGMSAFTWPRRIQ